jgi:ParB family chromosome partitioning protein
MKRKALGKGLSSLIPEVPKRKPAPQTSQARPATEGLQQLDIDKIWPNRAQPREQFDQEKLDELARSLKSQGVLQPVIVRPAEGGTYELVAGERRWRAAQIAGLLKIPAVIREVTDDRLLELALIENLQREELNPIEEATAYQSLINDLGLSQQQAADRVGKQRTTVANALRLLNLPLEVQALVQNGRLTAGHAKPLAGLTNAKLQIELAQRIVDQGLSVRAVEQLVRRPESSAKRQQRGAAEKRDPNVVAAEEALQSALGTKVRIAQGRTGAGRLELHFYSAEELDRIYDLVMKATRKK